MTLDSFNDINRSSNPQKMMMAEIREETTFDGRMGSSVVKGETSTLKTELKIMDSGLTLR